MTVNTLHKDNGGGGDDDDDDDDDKNNNKIFSVGEWKLILKIDNK
jgi:hypothetical protein